MADGNGNGHGNGHVAPQAPLHLIQIALMPSGQIMVSAPTMPNGKVNEMPTLYLLERGRMLIEDKIRADQQDAPLIERVGASALPRLRQ